jgi:hypothetical protein
MQRNSGASLCFFKMPTAVPPIKLRSSVTFHTNDFQRQIELEIDMSNLGAVRFASRVNKEVEQERGGETKASG